MSRRKKSRTLHLSVQIPDGVYSGRIYLHDDGTVSAVGWDLQDIHGDRDIELGCHPKKWLPKEAPPDA